jgi:hypothetical protein
VGNDHGTAPLLKNAETAQSRVSCNKRQKRENEATSRNCSQACVRVKRWKETDVSMRYCTSCAISYILLLGVVLFVGHISGRYCSSWVMTCATIAGEDGWYEEACCFRSQNRQRCVCGCTTEAFLERTPMNRVVCQRTVCASATGKESSHQGFTWKKAFLRDAEKIRPGRALEAAFHEKRLHRGSRRWCTRLTRLQKLGIFTYPPETVHSALTSNLHHPLAWLYELT